MSGGDGRGAKWEFRARSSSGRDGSPPGGEPRFVAVRQKIPKPDVHPRRATLTSRSSVQKHVQEALLKTVKVWNFRHTCIRTEQRQSLVGLPRHALLVYFLDITVFQVVSLLQLALLGTWYISAFFE